MINCPKCSKSIDLDPESAGPDGKVKVTCDACGTRFAVKVNRPALKLGGSPGKAFERRAAPPAPAPARGAGGAPVLAWDRLFAAVGSERPSAATPLLTAQESLVGPVVPLGVVSHARIVPSADLNALSGDPGALHSPTYDGLSAKATQLGAHAVIGIRTQVIWREKSDDFLVWAEGTAVRLP